MAAPTISEIRAGLAANLGAIADVQVSAYMLGNATPPTIHVFPEEVEFDGAMGRGADTWRFTLQAFVGLVSDQGAQKRLDLMLAPSGATSIKAAVETDRTLGGLEVDARVVSASGYRVYVQADGNPVLGCEWSCTVIATGA